MKTTITSEQVGMVLDKFYSLLHDKIGECVCCGKRDCPGRKEHSQLPWKISLEELDAAGASLLEHYKKGGKSNGDC